MYDRFCKGIQNRRVLERWVGSLTVTFALLFWVPARAQTEEAFLAEVATTINKLPSIWDVEVVDAIGQAWSPEARACVRDLKIVVNESEDPLAVRYEDSSIILSRGYVELLSQATLFTFMTMLGAIPDQEIEEVLDRHEAVLAARRDAYISYRRYGSSRPGILLDYGYAESYKGRLSEAISGTTLPQVRHAADMLNGAVLIFALLHEAGHHTFRHCPQSMNIDPELDEEVWADQFAMHAFRNEAYPTLLATDAVRILHAYKVADSFSVEGGLRCRLSLIVDELEAPHPEVFMKDGMPSSDAEKFAANLGQLIPVYRERYGPPDC